MRCRIAHCSSIGKDKSALANDYIDKFNIPNVTLIYLSVRSRPFQNLHNILKTNFLSD